jgi:hypothetical protein
VVEVGDTIRCQQLLDASLRLVEAALVVPEGIVTVEADGRDPLRPRPGGQGR